MADQTPVAPPTPTPFYLQPALWIAILTPICAVVSTKLGVHLDAAQLAAVLIPVAAVVVGLLHHDQGVTSAQIDAHAQVTAATVQAAAGKSPEAAATELAK